MAPGSGKRQTDHLAPAAGRSRRSAVLGHSGTCSPARRDSSPRTRRHLQRYPERGPVRRCQTRSSRPIRPRSCSQPDRSMSVSLLGDACRSPGCTMQRTQDYVGLVYIAVTTGGAAVTRSPSDTTGICATLAIAEDATHGPPHTWPPGLRSRRAWLDVVLDPVVDVPDKGRMADLRICEQLPHEHITAVGRPPHRRPTSPRPPWWHAGPRWRPALGRAHEMSSSSRRTKPTRSRSAMHAPTSRPGSPRSSARRRTETHGCAAIRPAPARRWCRPRPSSTPSARLPLRAVSVP